MKPLYFLRHGESESNVKGVYVGGLDSPLTEAGRKQAEAAVGEIKPLGIERIISSSSTRAYDTAKIVAAGIGFPVDQIETDDRLKEPNIGKLKGTTSHGLPGYIKAAHEPGNPLEVEPLESLVGRIKQFINDRLQDRSRVTLVVGHNGSGTILRAELIGRTDYENLHAIPNCQAMELGVDAPDADEIEPLSASQGAM